MTISLVLLGYVSVVISLCLAMRKLAPLSNDTDQTLPN